MHSRHSPSGVHTGNKTKHKACKHTIQQHLEINRKMNIRDELAAVQYLDNYKRQHNANEGSKKGEDEDFYNTLEDKRF